MEYEFNKGYYHFAKDLNAYPDAWCYVVWSSRGQGKTYSALWYALVNSIPVAYIKRTKDDVELICTDDKEVGIKTSPYVPINRDHDTDVKATLIKKGVGGFYRPEDDAPITYCFALSSAKSVKGFDVSVVDWMLFDEFIPQAGEIVRHAEGEMMLDMYMTISRDREQRGRPPLKLILFANSEDIATPITRELEIIDDMAEMNNIKGDNIRYLDDRGILLHKVAGMHKYDNTGIFAAMSQTAWGRKTFGAEFSHNDFSCVASLSLRGMKPIIHLQHKSHDYYIYRRYVDGLLYMCASKAKCIREYNLDREIDAKRFYVDDCIDLMNDCIDDKMRFQKYSMYDLIMNYKRYFDI